MTSRRLKARLRTLNPAADDIADRSWSDRRGNAPSARRSTMRRRRVADVDRWLNVEALRGHVHGHDHDHDEAIITSRPGCIEEDRPVAIGKLFLEKLGRIIGRYGDLLLRVKGVIHASGDPRPIVIHGVQRMFHPPVRLHRLEIANRARGLSSSARRQRRRRSRRSPRLFQFGGWSARRSCRAQRDAPTRKN